jgi:hypothetical protein
MGPKAGLEAVAKIEIFVSALNQTPILQSSSPYTSHCSD